MKLSRFWNAGACAALLSLAVAAQAADLTASGTVLGTDGKPLSEVTVSLALAKISSTTDASGAWILGSTPVGIASHNTVPVAPGRLMLEDGRLSVRFEGRDVAGRGTVRGVAAPRPSVVVARAADIPDTLLYFWKGKVRLRDTISVARTGIVRTLDTTLNPSIVYGYLTDERDGQTYRIVKIGTQVWMAQNLNFKTDSSFCYGNNTANCTKYGRLYKWAAAMGLNDSCNTKSCESQVAAKRRGACPSGWHVPKDAEWTKLTDTTLTKETAAIGLKATNDWSDTLKEADDYGFTVLSAGYRLADGSFSHLGFSAYVWSASVYYVGSGAWDRYFSNGYANVYRSYGNKPTGLSLRCLQD
jgi:uncharacterized protein (TIGR02145 family)